MGKDKDKPKRWVLTCAWCGRTFERGEWADVEAHANAERTHGICPSCFKKAAPGLPYPKQAPEPE